MFDIGWSEILVIAVVMIVVVGPKDLPKMLRAFGKATAKMRTTASEFRAQFDEALREAELDDVKKTIDDVKNYNPRKTVTDLFEPIRTAGDELRSNLSNTILKPDADTAGPMDSPLDLSQLKEEEAKPMVAAAEPIIAQVKTVEQPAQIIAVKKPKAPVQKPVTKTVATKILKPAAEKTAAKKTAVKKPAVKKADTAGTKPLVKTTKTTKKTGTDQ